MAYETHIRAREWVAERLGAEDVGRGATFHLRGRDGRRIKVAGRHIEGRQPNYFAIGPTLAGSPFDDLVVVLFDPGWRVEYAYRLPIEAVVDHHKQPGQQGCRLMIRDDCWRRDPRVQSLD